MDTSSLLEFLLRQFTYFIFLVLIFCLLGFWFSIPIIVIIFMLLLLRILRRCDCVVCRAYLSSSWKTDFDNIADWYTYLLRRSPTGTIQIHILGDTITTNPANVEYILNTHFQNFPKGKHFSTIFGDLLGHGIFNVDGDQWQLQHKMASQLLNVIEVQSHAFNIVSEEIQSRLLRLLDYTDGDTVDLQDVFRRFSFDTICKISFGLDPKYLTLWMPTSQFANAFDTATRLSATQAATAPLLLKLKKFMNIGSERELRKAIGRINIFAREIIKIHQMKKVSEGKDLLSSVMASVHGEKNLRDIMVNFLFAGRDTISAGLTAFFLLLSSHPAVEAAILDEISRVLSGRSVSTSQKLREMQYLHAAIYECMRLYPPVHFNSMFCVNDDVLADGTIVRRGTQVTYNSYAMGRMEAVWGSDCEEFKPERWLKNGVFSPESPFKFPVFGAGPRDCLGKEMALMQMKAAIASVLPIFEIQVEGRPTKFANRFTAIFEGGLPALVRKRC